MDNFSVRSERNFHNLVVKPNHMYLLEKPNGYASAMGQELSLPPDALYGTEARGRALRCRRPARITDQAARR